MGGNILSDEEKKRILKILGSIFMYFSYFYLLFDINYKGFEISITAIVHPLLGSLIITCVMLVVLIPMMFFNRKLSKDEDDAINNINKILGFSDAFSTIFGFIVFISSLLSISIDWARNFPFLMVGLLCCQSLALGYLWSDKNDKDKKGLLFIGIIAAIMFVILYFIMPFL